MRNWLKTTLFVSVFSPALLSLAYVQYTIDGFSGSAPFFAAVGLFGIAITLGIMRLIQKHGEVIAFTAKKVENNDVMMLGVISTYIVPFLTKGAEITSGLAIAIICGIAFVLWFVGSLPPHPVLRLLKFRFYKVESSTGMVYTLISKRDLLHPNHVHRVKRISSSMLVEVP